MRPYALEEARLICDIQRNLRYKSLPVTIYMIMGPLSPRSANSALRRRPGLRPKVFSNRIIKRITLIKRVKRFYLREKKNRGLNLVIYVFDFF